MLPSMPLLMTPIKELADDSSDTSDDSPVPLHSTENGHAFESNAGEALPTEELKILVMNSCPAESTHDVSVQPDSDKVSDKPHIPEKRSLPEPLSTQKKKKKTQHKKTLAALTPESGASLENSAHNFAQAYFQKVRSQLDEEKWTQFLQELVDFEGLSEKRPTELYHRMEVLLSPHKELIDEFLAFLLPHQALQVNRFMSYLLLHKMKEFFRKLNILLMKRQAQQVYSALETLVGKVDMTLADVKGTMLPLLKSSPLLTNLFLELLPGERAPDSLMTVFEQVDLKDDSLFETIVVPDCPDPYGNENCICSCHTSQKNRHCISCGIKYVNGRVYLQYGKVLRPAKVTFKGNKHVDLRKWEEDKCRSRRKFLPKTMLSPSCIDHRLNIDSEDDCGVKKSPRTPRARAARPKVSKKGASGSKEEEILEGISPLVESKNVVIEENVIEELAVDTEIKHDGNEDREFDEVVLENECNTEEDEEEDVNKCLHSENESSLEAGDINKELESGNGYTFEDEKVEDIENSEVVQNELPKEGLGNSLEEMNAAESATHSSVNIVSGSNPDGYNGKTDLSKIEVKTEVKVESMDTNFEHNNVTIKQEPESTNDIKDTEMRSVALRAEQNAAIGKPYTSIDMYHIKAEDDIHIMDVYTEQCSSGTVDLVRNTNEVDSAYKEWTREEDKIILQTFQHENGLEQTVETASHQLPNRSRQEIQERFDVLLKLLKEMISDESNSNP